MRPIHSLRLSLFLSLTIASGGFRCLYAASPVNTSILPASNPTANPPPAPTPQDFTYTFTDVDGATTFREIQVSVSASGGPSAVNNCYFYVWATSPVPTIYLANDQGNGWIGTGAIPHPGGSLQNSSCYLDLANSSASFSGSTFSITLRITFKAAYAGYYQQFMWSQDSSFNAVGWDQRGVWTVTPGGASPAPRLTSLTPSTGSGSIKDFVFVVTDPNGADNVRQIQMLIDSQLSFSNNCRGYIWVNAAVIYLSDDSGSQWASSGVLGSGGTLQNSRCRVHLANSKQEKLGNTVTITLRVEFLSAFTSAALRYWYAWTDDHNNNGGDPWRVMGSWTVTPDITAPLISGLTVVPQANSATISWDTPGEESDTRFIFGTSPPAANPNLIFPQLTLTHSVGPGQGLASLQPGTTYHYKIGSNDLAGNPSTATGQFTMPGGNNQPPVTNNVTPAPLTGRVRQITFQFADPNGFTDLSIVGARIAASYPSGPSNQCYFDYVRATDTLRLYNPNGVGIAGQIPLAPGNSIANANCRITGSEQANGTNLNVSLTVTALSGLSGLLQIYEFATDTAGQASANPSTSRGQWTVCPSGVQSNAAPAFECTEYVSLGNNEYSISTSIRVPNGGLTVTELRFMLSNTKLNQGFGCTMIADPSTGTMYLEDDIGHVGPNPRDRYINGRLLQPKALDDPTAIDWPNNSQCTLKEAGSSIATDGQLAVVNFRVSFKSNIKGSLAATGIANTCSTPSSCIYSGLVSLGTLTLLAQDQTPSVLSGGFSNALETGFRVESASGKRETFYLRYRHLNGIQQLRYAWLNVSPNSLPDAGGSNTCQVRVDLWTEQVQLAGASQTGFLGHSGPLENSQCRLYPGPGISASVVTRGSLIQLLSATDALLRLDIEFISAGWTGLRYLHRAVSTSPAAPTQWQNPDGAAYTIVTRPANLLTSLAAFQACLNTPNPNITVTCVLADGVYLINTGAHLEIKRSNVVARGASKHGTILLRERSGMNPYPYRGAMLAMYGPETVNGVNRWLKNIVISDLTFDGARSKLEVSLGPVGLTDGGDLTIRGVEGSDTYASDESQAGVVIRDTLFVNSPFSSIAMHPALGDLSANLADPPPPDTRLPHIVIRNNGFRDSMRAPIHIGLNGQWWASLDPPLPVVASGMPRPNPAEYGKCDKPGGQAGDLLPEHAAQKILIRNNFFEDNDTGSTGFDATRDVTIQNNAMLNNYSNGLDCGGGAIAVQSCGKSINILDNFLWNRDVFTYPSFCPAIAESPNSDPDKFARAAGLEIWGTNFQIMRNWIEYFPDEGVGLMAVQNVTLGGNLIRNNSRGIRQRLDILGASPEADRPGIRLSTCVAAPGGSQQSATRQLQMVTIQNDNRVGNQNSIYQGYGVRMASDICNENSGSKMQSVTVILDANSPANKNREGAVCAPPLLMEGGSTAVPLCPNTELTLGQPANCTSAGCQ